MRNYMTREFGRESKRRIQENWNALNQATEQDKRKRAKPAAKVSGKRPGAVYLRSN